MKSLEIVILLTISLDLEIFMFKTNWPSIVMFDMLGFYILASGSIQGHYGPFVSRVMAFQFFFF